MNQLTFLACWLKMASISLVHILQLNYWSFRTHISTESRYNNSSGLLIMSVILSQKLQFTPASCHACSKNSAPMGPCSDRSCQAAKGDSTITSSTPNSHKWTTYPPDWCQRRLLECHSPWRHQWRASFLCTCKRTIQRLWKELPCDLQRDFGSQVRN